ncbi:hypothetical protein [Riemerella columbina]|uniref:hypothetical protein n=1 Tax=Riemerella columbina TaxID=103810 RepID=UPI0003635A18|nr:hypothetical protein [Riemerella columbina]
MAQSFYGSINYDKLLESLKTGKLKTYKHENGTRYINVNIYISDEPDQYKNDGSISVPMKEEYHQDNIRSVFVGNLKKSTPKVQDADAQDFQDDDDDLPF